MLNKKGTVEWEALEKPDPDKQTPIFEKIGVLGVNDNIHHILSYGNIEAINHSRMLWFEEWINNSPLNKKWYKKNFWSNFNFLYWGRIELLWDIFKVEDEKTKPRKNYIFDYRWNILFDRASAEKQQNIWKWKIPDWKKYLDFLPWDNKNKSEFLQKVLWLSFTGCYQRFAFNKKGNGEGHFGMYWSKEYEDGAEYLIFNSDNSAIDYNHIWAFALPLRLIEK